MPLQHTKEHALLRDAPKLHRGGHAGPGYIFRKCEGSCMGDSLTTFMEHGMQRAGLSDDPVIGGASKESVAIDNQG